MKTDNVNHPSHYNNGGIECIDAIEAATKGLDGCMAFDIGNAIKYLWRFKDKNGAEDLRKSIWYIQHAIDLYEEKKEDPANERIQHASTE